jgi:hypothetical protein
MEAGNICSDTDVDIHSADRVCNSFHKAENEQYERNTQYITSSAFCLGCHMEFLKTRIHTILTCNLFMHC